MTRQTATALQLEQIFGLIETPSEWLAELKKQELQRADRKPGEIREAYQRLGGLLDLLRGKDEQRRVLRDLYGHLPKLTLPQSASRPAFALHEFFLLKDFLYHYRNLQAYLRRQGWMDRFLLPDLDSLFRLLDPEESGLPAFRLSGAYSDKLSRFLADRLGLENKLRHARASWLQEAKQELELPQLKEEFVLSRTQTELAERLLHSPFYVLAAENVANYSFILADDEQCLELKKRLSLLAQQQEKEEDRILKDLSRQVLAALPLLRSALAALAQTAWRFLLADFALTHSCCIPSLTRKKSIRVKGAVNLPLKLRLQELGRRYQSLDYSFDQPVSVITGPNMGGKTTILKTLGQLCALAGLAFPLPCAEAELPLFDRIWYNQDDTSASADLSTFGREVVSFTEALQEEGSTLFLLDEFARGTNPAEGELLASAVLRHLATTQNVCVAATHFTAPALLEGIAHFSIAGLDEETLSAARRLPLSPTQRIKALSEAMDYSLKRLTRNAAPPQSAIRVARVLGLPEAILRYIPGQDR